MLNALLFNTGKDYRNYRWFFTSDGSLVVGGKSDEQNELVLKNFLKPEYVVMHTSKPGSGFMIIQKDNPSKRDLDECAVFCACFSKQWKNLKGNKEKISIDIFKGEQIYKTKLMKKGTFGIKGEKKTINVKPELVVVIQKGKVRAVPKISIKKKKSENGSEVLGEINPGKLSKEEVVEKLVKKIKDKFHFPVSKDEIMQAIPSDKLSVK